MTEELEARMLMVESVHSHPLGSDRLMLRLAGRSPGSDGESGAGAVLLVDAEGQRHQFEAIPQPRPTHPAGDWQAAFSLPAWLGQSLEGTMTLMLGGDSVSVPPPEPAPAPESNGVTEPQSRAGQSEPEADQERAWPAPLAGAAEPPGDDPAAAGERAPVDPTGEALRAQLQERAREEARLRGELADLRARLAGRTSSAARFEAMREELRAELDAVRELVEEKEHGRAEIESRALVLAGELAEVKEQLSTVSRERDELRDQLQQLLASGEAEAAIHEAALAEVEALRAELDRLGSDLAARAQEAEAEEAGLDAAEALLAEARALTASLRHS